jgi:molybdate transport system substrate-binding protein
MTKLKLVTEFGASMGETYNAIPVRLNRGEAFDVVIMFAPALSDLIKNGKVRADSAVDLARSSIAMAVQAGAPKPDISTVDALKRTLLAAKSIAYSDSGVYLSTEIVGELPSGAQRITRSAAGIPVTAKHPEAAKALIP